MSIDRQKLEWSEIKRDLKALQRITEEENGRRLAVRTACAEACGKIFQAVGVALPPTIGHLGKLLFCPISALCLKIYPRNINYMPVVNFVARLDLDPNI